MAAFTDQFQRRDALALPPPSVLQTSTGRIIRGAQRVLCARTSSELTAIALAIDARIETQAGRVGSHFRKQMVEARVPSRTADKITHSSYIRLQNEDLLLLDAIGIPTAVHSAAGPKVNVQAWDVWAVFALWKAFDYLDALEEPQDPATAADQAPIFQWLNAKSVAAYSRSAQGLIKQRQALGTIAVEASSAFERMRSALVLHEAIAQLEAKASKRAAELVDAIERKYQADRKKASQKAARIKNAPFNAEGARAVQIVRAKELQQGFPFGTWKDAISHLMQNMIKPKSRESDDDEFYQDYQTLDGYLKENGWSPTKGAASGKRGTSA
jgi:hypothetical protein